METQAEQRPEILAKKGEYIILEDVHPFAQKGHALKVLECFSTTVVAQGRKAGDYALVVKMSDYVIVPSSRFDNVPFEERPVSKMLHALQGRSFASYGDLLTETQVLFNRHLPELHTLNSIEGYKDFIRWLEENGHFRLLIV